MAEEIRTISLQMPFRMGSVNCYLIDTGSGHILIDTGGSNGRADLEKELESAGCTKADDLKLVILTHGDFDHSGNAAHLREKFGARIAMHHDDSGMVERGDMFWNRKQPNVLIRIMIPIFSGFGKSKRFKPDLIVGDGYDLSEHGFDAKVLSIPGHSKGSIGILTAGGDLFCGDLFENRDRPAPSSLMDDPVAACASVEKLGRKHIDTVYPGHGRPFPMELVMENKR